MAECRTCGKSIRAWEVIGGACEDCFSHLKKKEDAAESQLRQKEDAAERELAQQENMSGYETPVRRNLHTFHL